MKDGLNPKFAKMDSIVVRITRYCSYVSAAALAIIMVLAVVDVICAKFFHKSIPNATEYIQYLNVVIVFLAMAFVQVDRGHTSVDLFYGMFPKWLKWLIHFIFYLVGIAINGLFGYYGIVLTISKFSLASKSNGASGFYLWPFALLMSIGLFLLALTNVWCVVRACVYPSYYEFKQSEQNPAPNNQVDEEGDL